MSFSFEGSGRPISILQLYLYSSLLPVTYFSNNTHDTDRSSCVRLFCSSFIGCRPSGFSTGEICPGNNRPWANREVWFQINLKLGRYSSLLSLIICLLFHLKVWKIPQTLRFRFPMLRIASRLWFISISICGRFGLWHATPLPQYHRP